MVTFSQITSLTDLVRLVGGLVIEILRKQAEPPDESVVQEGEYSLFFFGSEYCHAVLKAPESQDFRVQENRPYL
jgi:hypothetical protein